MPLKFEIVLHNYCRKKKHHVLLFEGTGDKYFCLTVSALESLSRSGLGWRSGYETWPSHSVVFLGRIFYFDCVSLQPGTSYLEGG